MMVVGCWFFVILYGRMADKPTFVSRGVRTPTILHNAVLQLLNSMGWSGFGGAYLAVLQGLGHLLLG